MKITDYLKDNFIFLDGAIGTLLQKEGLMPGEFPEIWNITHPEIITEIHKAYYDSGSNVVSTNTFGANLLKFSKDELENIIKAAFENAKKAKKESSSAQEKWIALDIGPSGRMLSPFGDFDFEDAVSLFAETVKLGVKYGADLIFIETMNDSYETKAALLAAKENSNLPVFVSNAYSEDGKLMTGADPASMVMMLESMGADAIGLNCSLGPKSLLPIAKEYLKYASTPVLLKPNAGLPKVTDGKTIFDVSPEEFASSVALALDSGVKIAGGCCGTTPEYIRALTDTSKGLIPKKTEEKNITGVSSYTHAVIFGEKPVLIGERINPTGKKRFKEALLSNDIDYILKEGINQQEKGVDILDVNVGLPDINEEKMLKTAIFELSAVLDLPLQIDTSNPLAMESALRLYNGKAMINSVNGKKESMDAIFPLAKKYGGLIVALTLDENGIPETAEGRVKIAEKILAEAEKYGIKKRDIIFDPLCLTISADKSAGRETLRAVSLIKNKLGCHTSLGVSNVSFGLPNREIINSNFFALALASGLSCAIMNPYSYDMLKAYHAYLALMGLDDNCEKFIEFASTLPKENASQAQNGTLKKVAAEGTLDLKNAIVKGLKELSAELCGILLKTQDALLIVEEEIIPALDTVGVGFENKTIYLPQLLMSAEAAKSAFEKIKESMPTGSSNKCTVVLATVKGDIHDIGKNIVKLLLENYGFNVCDLGKDVPPEVVLEKAKELSAPIVGLSALMTTTVPAMEETISLIKKELPNAKTIVGGAVLTKEYAKKIGAHFYAHDAMETVRIAEKINAELNNN